jgi:hypothetical protein
MKLLAGSLVQLFVIVVLTITFAVSVTALSLWADSGAATSDSQRQAMSLRADVP